VSGLSGHELAPVQNGDFEMCAPLFQA